MKNPDKETTVQLVLYIGSDGFANVLRRQVEGYDVRRLQVLADNGDELELKVPGHKEATGYDRLQHYGNNNTYTYVPVARVSARVIDRDQDRYGHDVLTVEVPARRIV